MKSFLDSFEVAGSSIGCQRFQKPGPNGPERERERGTIATARWAVRFAGGQAEQRFPLESVDSLPAK